MLSIQNLSLGYHDKEVLHLREFSLSSGEHCLITGPSGSGKTTLLYAVAGVLSPRSGDITLASTAITALKPAVRDQFRGAHIGMIHQTLHMVNALSVLNNLLLAPFAVGAVQDVSYARELLASLGIAHKESAFPAQLSLGEQQRVAIARAAMNKPLLMAGDEPTSALDDVSAERVLELLFATAQLCGATLLIASHDARIYSRFSRRLDLGALS